MAGDRRNYNLAFQSTEAALRAGERIIGDDTLTAPPTPCSAVASPPCLVYELGLLRGSNQDPAFESDEWWEARAQRYSGQAATAW